MCIIAVAGDGKTVNHDTFNRCFYKNSDGFGMMWVENGSIQTFKTLNVDDAYAKYVSVDERFKDDTPIVLHFRIGTQGPNDLTNCHPFNVNKDVSFCHNGIIMQYSEPYLQTSDNASPYRFVKGGMPNDSDTVLFNKAILTALPLDFVENSNTIEMIEEMITTDKMVFLDVLSGEPRITYANKKNGYVDSYSGIWYSNKGYEVFTPGYSIHRTEHKYCSECAKTRLLSIDEKKSGICTSCASNTCEVCDTVCNRDSLVRVTYAGEEHVFCTGCIEPHSDEFFGLFDNKIDINNLKVGDVVYPEFSTSLSDAYVISLITVKTISIRVVGYHSNSTVLYSHNSFLKQFNTGAVSVW